MPERHQIGTEWIEVPDCICAQGAAAVAAFVQLPAEARAAEIAEAQQAAQRRHEQWRQARLTEREVAERPTPPAANDQAQKE